MQSQIVLIVARTKTYVMYPPNVHISIFSNRPITSSNTSSSKEMPRLLIYLSHWPRPVSPSECLVCISGYTPLQRHTLCLTNTIQSSLIVVTPYVPVLVRHLFESVCCRVSDNFPLWCHSCALWSVPVPPVSYTHLTLPTSQYV